MHSAEVGDCIGFESCADLKSRVDEPINGGGGTNRRRSRLRMESSAAAAAERKYPPPIPWLARDDNSDMPRVMRKIRTGDGRLVIREEKVKCHEYLRSHRSNGRLVINVIKEAVEEQTAVDRISSEEINGVDERIRDPTVEKAVPEYYKYNGTRVNPCGGFAAAAVPTFRPPVHT